jgi:S-adenosylmethionine hydrolase
MKKIITLTTDFGTEDPYVAAMKGVILSINQDILLLDLSHSIPHYNILEGAFFLLNSTRYFPSGTIHVAVIDPGVGSPRRPVSVKTGGQFFVCPDNGLLTLLLRDWPLEEAYIINNKNIIRSEVSETFHGRDIFAPAAAHLSKGLALKEMGESIDGLITLDIPEPYWSQGNDLMGEIFHFDSFGNGVTNINRKHLKNRKIQSVKVKSHTFSEIMPAYSSVPLYKSLVLWGSSDYLEVSINQGSAREKLELKSGEKVIVTCF